MPNSHRGRLKLKEDEVKDEAPPMSPPKPVGRNPIPVGDTDTAAHYSPSDSDLETVHIPISDTEAVHLTQAECNSIVKLETCLGQLTRRDQLYEVTENSLEIPVDDHDPDRSVQIDAVYGSVQIEAVDRDSPTVDRGARHFIGCLFHSKQSNRRYLLRKKCRSSNDDPLVL